MGDKRVQTALITGPVGSGKTVVAAEIGEVLSERDLPVAVIDLDWLCWIHPAPGNELSIDSFLLGNLCAVWPNFTAAGIRYAVLARAVWTQAHVDELRNALPDARLSVVRLTVSSQMVAERLRGRDSGVVLKEHLAQAEQMSAALDDFQLDVVRISNDDRAIREVAEEVVGRLAWI
jgi:adenylylsulfate kinase